MITTAVLLAIPGTSGAEQKVAGSYVALGDSFTAGPSIPRQLTTLPGCQRSDHNYPHLLASSLDLAPLRDASCYGATSADMTEPQLHDISSGPPNPAQFDRLDANTTLVTIGIGGNDIGFTDIAVTCVVVHPCRNVFLVNSHDEISTRIAATGTKVAALLDGIHRRSPRAKIFVVGYPAVVPATGTGCSALLLDPTDVPYLRAKEQELNTMLRTQAAAHRSAYVDLYRHSIGHDPCQPTGVRWVEPIIGATGEVLHPNAIGMQGIASAVLTTMHQQPTTTTTTTTTLAACDR